MSKRRPSYRSSPVDNRVWDLTWELVSTLTDIRPVFEVRETDPDNKAKKSLCHKIDADDALLVAIQQRRSFFGYGTPLWPAVHGVLQAFMERRTEDESRRLRGYSVGPE